MECSTKAVEAMAEIMVQEMDKVGLGCEKYCER